MNPGKIYASILPICPHELAESLRYLQEATAADPTRGEVRDAAAVLWLVTSGLALGHVQMPYSLHEVLYSVVLGLLRALPAGEVPDRLPPEVLK